MQQREDRHNEKNMISVIICTYNREKYIYNVLRSVAENDYPRSEYEIVLVNNNSTDGTRSECERFAKEYSEVSFHYVEEHEQGLSYARNAGIRASQGDVLVYVDDDATVNRDYLKTYGCFFDSHAEAVAAGGPILPVYETAEPAWFSHFTRALITGKVYLGDKERRFPKGKFPGGGNAAYRKSVFDAVGLFNVELGRKGEGLMGAEEKDLFDKMTARGMAFYYLPNSILYHIIPEKKLTKDYFDRLTYGIGVSERYRTLRISKTKYLKRLLSECVKWAATIAIWVFFVLRFQPRKGCKVVAFRWNVTRGLLFGTAK